MTLEELADHWDAEAAHNGQRAEDCRSIDAYVRYQAYAQQLRWCATQLRLVLGNARRNGQDSGITTAGTEHLAAELLEDGHAGAEGGQP